MDINTCWVYPFAKHHHGNHQHEVIESQKSQHVQRRASKYCWWKKSCTTWDVKFPVNNGINYQPQLVSRISSIDHMSRKIRLQKDAEIPSLGNCLGNVHFIGNEDVDSKRGRFSNRKYIFQPLIFRGHVNFRGSTTSWWLFHQPIWNICASQIVSSPQVEIKQNVSKHQLDQVCCLLLLPKNLT